jgi:hypothetical protein
VSEKPDAENSCVEFYTVLATGESGMSQSGLAILAGVSPQALIKLETTLLTLPRINRGGFFVL